MIKVKKDLVGQKFGMLIVIERAEDYLRPDGKYESMWKCECTCEDHNIRIVRGSNLTNLHTKSCGCLRNKKNKKEPEHTKRNYTKHGESNNRLYRIWASMCNRCSNKSSKVYKNYGARGISVCEEWKNNYIKFKEWALENGYNDNLTIERIDVNGNYYPENCKWATMEEQQNNKRNNHLLTYNGETHTESEWAKILNVSRQVIDQRLKSGWSIEETLSTPLKHRIQN